ncbi:MAG: DegT/DnrJ/EryC1/StrS family aminotransferase [Terriglobales bacterium]
MTKLAVLGGTPVRQKPFPSWPVWDDNEERALLEVLHSGKWWRFSYGVGVELSEPSTGDRSRVVQFQEAFARHHEAAYGVACANGTAAIEILLKALGIGPGDEVVVPAYTYVATATAVLQVNAVPIFVDIDSDTYNIDPARIEAAITPRTRAVIPVHFAGQAADMDAVLEIAGRHKLFVVEDAAHAHGAEWKGRKLGALGDGGTFSFQASKNMTAGEGGIILTNSRELAVMCESYLWAGRQQGHPWYEHHRLGWNYRLTEFQAAILLQQLKRLDYQNTRRMENAAYLSKRLAAVDGIRPLKWDPRATRQSFHIYMFRYSPEAFGGLPKSEFVKALAAEGVPCIGGYSHALYKNPMFRNKDFYPRGCPITCGHYSRDIDYAAFEQLCPVTERACRSEAVWLEHRLLLGSTQDMDDIVDAVEKVRSNAARLLQLASATQ